MYKVIFCGDRNWTDLEPIKRELRRLIEEHGETNLIVIEGAAKGADRLSGQCANAFNVHVAKVPALWGTRFKGAGPQRNAAMLALGPDEVVAFHSNIETSKGTKDMVERSRKAGVPTKVVSQ